MKEIRKLKLEELNRLGLDTFKQSPKIPIVVVLDNIRSGLNVGSVFRSSDAFRVEKVILTGITAKPPHKEILKTAIGANNSVEWEYIQHIDEAIFLLKNQHYRIIGIEQTTASIELNDFEVSENKKYALVFGNEVNGLSESIISEMDAFIEIAQFGTKHSLNVSVCAGIIIHYFASKLLKAIV